VAHEAIQVIAMLQNGQT